MTGNSYRNIKVVCHDLLSMMFVSVGLLLKVNEYVMNSHLHLSKCQLLRVKLNGHGLSIFLKGARYCSLGILQCN